MCKTFCNCWRLMKSVHRHICNANTDSDKKKTNKKFINRAKATVVGREWKKYCINYYIYMHAPSIKSTDSWLIAINSILMKTISKRTKSSIIWSLGSASDTIHAILWIRLRYSIMKNWMSNECKGKNLSLCIDRECCFFSVFFYTRRIYHQYFFPICKC